MGEAVYMTENTKKYDIPLSHLDHSYVKACSDVKELEKIFRVLKSGEEGYFPELERLAENKLTELAPNSRALRKELPLSRLSDLDPGDKQDLVDGIKHWNKEMKNKEDMMTSGPGVISGDLDLPPIRSGVIGTSNPENGTKHQTSNKRVKPRDHKEWEKVDLDKELEKVDNEDKNTKQKQNTAKRGTPANLDTEINAKGLSTEEKLMKANREKDKGNEAFRSGDYEESVLYYSRSISLLPTTASYNNRALAYLKTGDWDKCLADLGEVLNTEPNNIKGLLRRGTALKGKKEFGKAVKDFKRVLELEPANKKAQDLMREADVDLKKFEQEKKEKKAKGRRLLIEDVDGSESEDEASSKTNGEMESQQACGKEDIVENGFEDENQHKSCGKSETKDPNSSTASGNVKSGDAKDIWNSDEVGEKDENSVAATSATCDKDVRGVSRVSSSSDAGAVSSSTDAGAGSSSTDSGAISSSSDAGAMSSSSDAGAMSSSSDAGAIDETVESEKGMKVDDHNGHGRDAAGDEEAEDETENQAQVSVAQSRPVFYVSPLPADVAKLRQQGNDLFRTGQYAEALVCYENAINKLDEVPEGNEYSLSLLYSNQAACKLKTGDCSSAIADCTMALDYVPHSIKPLLRRASAFETKERYRRAYADYKHVLSIDSSVEQAHQGASRCQKHLTDQDGSRWRDKLPAIVNVFPWEIPEIVDSTSPPKPTSQPASATQGASFTAPLSAPVKTPVQEKVPIKEKVPVQKVPEIKTPIAPESPEEKFDKLKSSGNKHVQKGEFQQAVECYTGCIRTLPDRVVSYTNRALCFLKLNKPQDAVDDCNEALKREKENTKALYRRAQARKMLEEYKYSLADLLQLLKIEPTNTAAKKEIELIKKLYRKEFEKTVQDKKQKTSNEAPPKQRRKMKIEEVDDDDEEEEEPKPQSENAKPSHTDAAGPPTTNSTTSSTSPQSTSKSNKSRKSKSKSNRKATETPGASSVTVSPPSVPRLEKATPYEFLQAWNSLKTATSVEPFAELMQQIQPKDLKRLISNKLDGQMLHKIISCVKLMVGKGDVERGYSVLHHLRTVDRFSTVQMFMSADEKKDIGHVCDVISRHRSSAYSEQDLTKLRKDYGS
ncbi:sperm-associated antigen 1-like isoform X2 [Haliotis cracherodii]|uniref:sperm-associated antigen 1-like isoform X2 n=1 Tax=Haliotis cracherodii TaxID=6455 RepID=UPI0039E74096